MCRMRVHGAGRGCHSGEPGIPKAPYTLHPGYEKGSEKPVASSRLDPMGRRKALNFILENLFVNAQKCESEFNVRSSPKRTIRVPKPGRTSHKMSCYSSALQGPPWVVIWCDVVLMQLSVFGC
jgi:hypothetical protein